MTKPKIAIIISSIRDNRFGDKPAAWVHDIASARDDIDTEIVDLKEWPLPFFNEAASNLWAPTQNEVGQRWQKKIGEFDGYIFVIAEYNRSITAPMKNAFDFAYPEWNKKAAAVVGYGSVGAARAAEHLRTIAIELQMAPTRSGVHIGGGDFMAVWQQGKNLRELAHVEAGIKTMLDELVWWANALKTARAAG
jgi:NAD(P)H-dependent FMN reductase